MGNGSKIIFPKATEITDPNTFSKLALKVLKRIKSIKWDIEFGEKL